MADTISYEISWNSVFSNLNQLGPVGLYNATRAYKDMNGSKAYIERKDDKTAERLLLSSVARFPTSTANLLLGMLYVSQGKLYSALGRFKAAEQEPTEFIIKGVDFREQSKKYREALEGSLTDLGEKIKEMTKDVEKFKEEKNRKEQEQTVDILQLKESIEEAERQRELMYERSIRQVGEDASREIKKLSAAAENTINIIGEEAKKYSSLLSTVLTAFRAYKDYAGKLDNRDISKYVVDSVSSLEQGFQRDNVGSFDINNRDFLRLLTLDIDTFGTVRAMNAATDLVDSYIEFRKTNDTSHLEKAKQAAEQLGQYTDIHELLDLLKNTKPLDFTDFESLFKKEDSGLLSVESAYREYQRLSNESVGKSTDEAQVLLEQARSSLTLTKELSDKLGDHQLKRDIDTDYRNTFS